MTPTEISPLSSRHPPPLLTLSATSSTFGNQRVGTSSAAQTVTLTNSGGAPLNLTSSTINGSPAVTVDFGAANTSPTGAGSFAPATRCTSNRSLTPLATGAP